MPYINHVSTPNTERVAKAPYNFVPLPRQVFLPHVDGKLPSQDCFHSQMYTGYLECTLTTLTPLYTRNPRRRGAVDNDPNFCAYTAYDAQGLARPVIPGRTLRGLLRTLVEIMSFSMIQPVGQRKAFFRTMQTDSPIGNRYLDRMGRDDALVIHAGLVVIDARRHTRRIRPSDGYVRVHRDALPNDVRAAFPTGASYRDIPAAWHVKQHCACWVHISVESTGRIQADQGDRITFTPPEHMDDWVPAVLVLTGHMQGRQRNQGKQHELLVLCPVTNGEEDLEIPDEVWERFNDEQMQISQWQQAAFPKDHGRLCDGTPVFYLLDADGKVSFLGRARMFRLPYDLGPNDLIATTDARKRQGVLVASDMAERIFGFIPRGAERKQGLRGRVRVEAAHLQGPVTAETFTTVMPLKPLMSPRPSCYAHYLTQTRDTGRQLFTYLADHQDRTQIRGHKLYHHRLAETPAGQLGMARGSGQAQEGRLSSRVRCVRENATFVFRVHFHNLTELELGALLCAVQLPDDHAHKVGMGKPLGLGSVRMQARAFRMHPPSRYASAAAHADAPPAFADLGISPLEDSECAALRQLFWRAIAEHAVATGELLTPDGQRARAEGRMPAPEQIARLADLFALLRAHRDGAPALSPTLTDYMGLQGEIAYRDTRVLPGPRHVGTPAPTPRMPG